MHLTKHATLLCFMKILDLLFTHHVSQVLKWFSNEFLKHLGWHSLPLSQCPSQSRGWSQHTSKMTCFPPPECCGDRQCPAEIGSRARTGTVAGCHSDPETCSLWVDTACPPEDPSLTRGVWSRLMTRRKVRVLRMLWKEPLRRLMSWSKTRWRVVSAKKNGMNRHL